MAIKTTRRPRLAAKITPPVKTTARKPAVVAEDIMIAPDLKLGRDPDMKYTGDEPRWSVQPEEGDRQLSLLRALTWYGRYCDRKQAKEQLLDFAARRGVASSDLKRMRGVHEREFNGTLAWVSRCGDRGLSLTQVELARIGDHLLDILRAAQPQPAEKEAETSQPTRPNIQDIMRERRDLAGGELEGLFDDFRTATNKSEPAVVGILTAHGVLPAHLPPLITVWEARRAEIEEAVAGTDAQLREGYSQFNKTALKGMIKFCDQVIAGLNSYITFKRATKAVRVRKPQSPERQARSVKYLKAFTDATIGLDLQSVAPHKIIGATEVWAYDTAKRRLHYYVADAHSGTLGVKGTAIVGFDAVKSAVKTVRKPGVIIPQLVKAGKPAARKVFGDLSTVATAPNGRTNEHIVILRAH